MKNRITTANDLRHFWHRQFAAWRGQRRITIGARKRDTLTIVVAVLGLLDSMKADGRLRGSRDWWTLNELAAFMRLSRETALDILAWLEDDGLMVVTRRREDGRVQTAERRLVLPNQVGRRTQLSDSVNGEFQVGRRTRKSDSVTESKNWGPESDATLRNPTTTVKEPVKDVDARARRGVPSTESRDALRSDGSALSVKGQARLAERSPLTAPNRRTKFLGSGLATACPYTAPTPRGHSKAMRICVIAKRTRLQTTCARGRKNSILHEENRPRRANEGDFRR